MDHLDAVVGVSPCGEAVFEQQFLQHRGGTVHLMVSWTEIGAERYEALSAGGSSLVVKRPMIHS